MMKNILLAGLGGFIGTVFRAFIMQIFKTNQSYFATFFINISGCLLIGLFAGLGFKYAGFSNNWKIFITTGVCGGFTTFSAFSMENVRLLQEDKLSTSLIYIALSIFLGIGATLVGYKIIN